jgi:hypothetical protein
MRREIEMIYHDLSISSPSVCVTVFFLAPGGTSHPWVNSSHTYPESGPFIRQSRSYGIFTKKNSSHLVSLIKVEGLFSPYIVTNFDIVNSESLV